MSTKRASIFFRTCIFGFRLPSGGSGETAMGEEAAVVLSWIVPNVERGAPPWMLDTVEHAEDSDVTVARGSPRK